MKMKRYQGEEWQSLRAHRHFRVERFMITSHGNIMVVVADRAGEVPLRARHYLSDSEKAKFIESDMYKSSVKAKAPSRWKRKGEWREPALSVHI